MYPGVLYPGYQNWEDGMTRSALEDWQALASLFSGLSHRARIAVLLGLYEGRSITDIVDGLDITRGALQSHLERLIDVQLVYRTEEADPPYALTPFGVFFAVFLQEHQEMLLEAVAAVEEAKAQAAEEFAEVPMSEDRVEQEVKRRKWELVGQELYDILKISRDQT